MGAGTEALVGGDDKVIPGSNFCFDWLLYFQSGVVPHFHIGGQDIWAKQYSAVWKHLASMGTI